MAFMFASSNKAKGDFEMNYGTTRPISDTSYSCVANDQTLVADATAGAVTITMPVLNVDNGRIITVIKSDASANVVGLIIPGGYSFAAPVDPVLAVQDASVTLVLTGTVWYSQEDAASIVQLQTATPGVAQTGHLNITGTAIAGSFSGSGAAMTGLVKLQGGVPVAQVGSAAVNGTLRVITGAGTSVNEPDKVTFTATVGGATGQYGVQGIGLLDPVTVTSAGLDTLALTIADSNGSSNATPAHFQILATDIPRNALLDVDTFTINNTPAGQVMALDSVGLNYDGVQVVGHQEPAVADATGAGDVVVQLNLLLAAIRAHGLIAT